MCSDTELLELFPGLPTDFRTKNIFRVVDGRSLFYLYVLLWFTDLWSLSPPRWRRIPHLRDR